MSRRPHRRPWLALRLAVAFAVACASVAFSILAAGPVGANMLLEARVTPPVDAVAWIVSQPRDCAEALRSARRLAHRRGRSLPDDLRLVSLGAADAERDDIAYELRGLHRWVVSWTLWFRGVRQTPVLIEYPQGSPILGSVVVIR